MGVVKRTRSDGSAREANPASFASSSEPLNLADIHSVDDLVRAMSRTASTGRQLGLAADVLEAMARDQDCFVVLTLAGASPASGQGLIIAELIERGIANAIVSTGDLIAHRLTDEPARRTDVVQRAMESVLETWDHNETVCSYKLNHSIGAQLAELDGENSILRAAYHKGVPVFVPAFADSELGLVIALANRLRESTGRHKLRFDPFEDLEHFAATLLRQNRLGLFSIGGGVAGQWSQQVWPFIELRHRRMGENVPLKRYHYAVRICPERTPMVALPDGTSVDLNAARQFVPASEGGRFGEAFLDATVGLPLIVAAVLARIGPHEAKDAVQPKMKMKAKPKKVSSKR